MTDRCPLCDLRFGHAGAHWTDPTPPETVSDFLRAFVVWCAVIVAFVLLAFVAASWAT